MRQGHQNKRLRGRNRKGPNPLTRTYESSGPDVKVRGTALHIAEKYSALSRDAQSAGDRVAAENYLQHAEHYYRIIAAAQAQNPQQFQITRDDDLRDDDDEEEIAASAAPTPVNGSVADPGAPQPIEIRDPLGEDERRAAVEEGASPDEDGRSRRRGRGRPPRSETRSEPRNDGDTAVQAEPGDATKTGARRTNGRAPRRPRRDSAAEGAAAPEAPAPAEAKAEPVSAPVED